MIGTLLLCGGVLGIALAIWAVLLEPRLVRIRRYEVPVAGLRAPLRAVVIGDLQPNKMHWPARRLTRLFTKLEAQERPDLVLWLGDFYDAPTKGLRRFFASRPRAKAWNARRLVPMDEIAEAVGCLRGRLGTFSVLGNHDWVWSGEAVEAALTAKGVQVLKDDVAVVEDAQAGRLQIVGYDDLSSGRTPDFERVHGQIAPGASLSLAHSPDTFCFSHGGPDLMLAGHTHGGQVRFPFIGAPLLPLVHSRYDWGWFEDQGRRLYVTSGLGASGYPIRFMCPAEVVVLTLMPGGDDG